VGNVITRPLSEVLLSQWEGSGKGAYGTIWRVGGDDGSYCCSEWSWVDCTVCLIEGCLSRQIRL
jgi:hypothetical protein